MTEADIITGYAHLQHVINGDTVFRKDGGFEIVDQQIFPFLDGAGKDIALLSAGGILTELIRAAEILEARGIDPEIWSFPCLKPLDRERVLALAKRQRDLITVEEHNITGGFGSAVCEVIAEAGLPCRVHRMGLKDVFASVVGNQAYLRHLYGMDGEAIAEKAAAIVNEKGTDAGGNS